jgi:transposase
MSTTTESSPPAAKGKKPASNRKQYTKEFKAEAVRLSQLPGMGPTKTAQDLGVDRSLISQWTKHLAQEGTEAFRGHGVRTAHEEELLTMRRRITVLEQEREILKKATEFFMKEHA